MWSPKCFTAAAAQSHWKGHQTSNLNFPNLLSFSSLITGAFSIKKVPTSPNRGQSIRIQGHIPVSGHTGITHNPINCLIFLASFCLSEILKSYWILPSLMSGIMICIEYFSCLMDYQMGLNWLTIQKDRLSFHFFKIVFRWRVLLCWFLYFCYPFEILLFCCREYLGATNKEMELSVAVVTLR